MLPETLISLACLIANKGELDTRLLESQLTEVEIVQVQKVIDSNACLPEKLEQMLKKQRLENLRNKGGTISMPTDTCIIR